jgi:hypothetical protein
MVDGLPRHLYAVLSVLNSNGIIAMFHEDGSSLDVGKDVAHMTRRLED